MKRLVGEDDYCCRLRKERLRMMERIKRMTIIHLLQAKRIEAEDDGEASR